MYPVTLPTLRGSTQRFVLARVHLRVWKARSCSYPTRTDQKKPRGTSFDRLPCDHISEITVPRSATKIATCLSGWRWGGAEAAWWRFLPVIPAIERKHFQFTHARFCELSHPLPTSLRTISCLQRNSPKLPTHFTVRFRTCLYLASEGDRHSPYSLYSWASSLVCASMLTIDLSSTNQRAWLVFGFVFFIYYSGDSKATLLFD